MSSSYCTTFTSPPWTHWFPPMWRVTFQNIEQLLVLPFRFHYYDQYVMGWKCALRRPLQRFPAQIILRLPRLEKKHNPNCRVKVIKDSFFSVMSKNGRRGWLQRDSLSHSKCRLTHAGQVLCEESRHCWIEQSWVFGLRAWMEPADIWTMFVF